MRAISPLASRIGGARARLWPPLMLGDSFAIFPGDALDFVRARGAWQPADRHGSGGRSGCGAASRTCPARGHEAAQSRDRTPTCGPEKVGRPVAPSAYDALLGC